MIDVDKSEAEARGFSRATLSEPLKLRALEAQNSISALWKEIEIRDRRIEMLELGLQAALEVGLRSALKSSVRDMSALVAKAEAVGK